MQPPSVGNPQPSNQLKKWRLMAEFWVILSAFSDLFQGWKRDLHLEFKVPPQSYPPQ